jgi:hypothetical protein
MKQITERQLRTAKRELDGVLLKLRKKFEEKHPRPGYEQEMEWEQRNLSPRRRHEMKISKHTARPCEEAERIMFDARMGKMDGDAFYKAISDFVKKHGVRVQSFDCD